ncbi:MAG: transporter substrate-binding domain-containing protein [Pseudonocardia sp.]|nr:transporter substrate-binding domain-containing protein [Pseudonocardia sp.]
MAPIVRRQFAKETLTRATIVPYPDNNTIFDAVADGRADLMVTDAVETRWQATLGTGLCAVHPDRPFTSSDKAYLVRQGDPAFLDRVNTWLRGAMSDGTYQRFARPWIG